MRSRERRRNSIEPKGELASRTLAMPADCNPRGDIFGGWIMALMDSAGKMSATPHAGGRVVTVSVSNITLFRRHRLLLYRSHAHRADLDHARCRSLGVAPGSGRARQGDRSRVHLCFRRRGWPPPRADQLRRTELQQKGGTIG